VLCVLRDFIRSELKEEIGGVPFVGQRFFWVDMIVGIEVFAERLGGVGCAVQCALALVTQQLEEVCSV